MSNLSTYDFVNVLSLLMVNAVQRNGSARAVVFVVELPVNSELVITFLIEIK